MSCFEEPWRRGKRVLRTFSCPSLAIINFQLACTTASGFAVLDGGSRLHYLCRPLPEHHAPYVRFNDGACDSNGRFFAESIHSKDQGIPGQLWMYDPDTAECKVVDEGPFTVSNHASLIDGQLAQRCRTQMDLVGVRARKPCKHDISAAVRVSQEALQVLYGLARQSHLRLRFR